MAHMITPEKPPVLKMNFNMKEKQPSMAVFLLVGEVSLTISD